MIPSRTVVSHSVPSEAFIVTVPFFSVHSVSSRSVPPDVSFPVPFLERIILPLIPRSSGSNCLPMFSTAKRVYSPSIGSFSASFAALVSVFAGAAASARRPVRAGQNANSITAASVIARIRFMVAPFRRCRAARHKRSSFSVYLHSFAFIMYKNCIMPRAACKQKSGPVGEFFPGRRASAPGRSPGRGRTLFCASRRRFRKRPCETAGEKI